MTYNEKDELVSATVEAVLKDIRENLGIDPDASPNSTETVRLHDVVQALNLTESEWLDE